MCHGTSLLVGMFSVNRLTG